MPINSGYSFYEYAGDGVTTRFPIQFSLGELKRAYVTCRVDNEVDGEGAPLYRELTDVPGDPGMIEVLGAVPGVGVPIVFRRIVPKELLLHLYANGSILDYPSLDESHLQLMMALHEVLDGYGLTNVFTDINMNGYKLTNVVSDPDDPDSIATVAFLGTYRQDALDAAIAAANSALEALGYRDTALGHANSAAASAVTAAAQVTLCVEQVDLTEHQVTLATAQAVIAQEYAIDSEGFADSAAASASTAGSAAAAAVAEVAADVATLDLVKLEKSDLNASGDAPMYVCRAWVNFDGTTTPPTIRASGNVSSVVRNGVGDYTVNFTTALQDEKYSLCLAGTGVNGRFLRIKETSVSDTTPATMTTAAVRLWVNSTFADSPTDAKVCNIAVFR